MNNVYFDAQKGYSLLQMSFALAVMGVLVAFLVPRMVEVVEDARDAKIKALGSGFKAAVYLAREGWYVAGKPENALGNFGKGNVIMSEAGWPVNVAGEGGDASASSANNRVCRNIWRALLVDAAPDVVVPGEPQGVADFIAEMDSGVCRYRYIEGDNLRFIEYNPAIGRITWQVR